jgi:hypothetical protein
MGCYYASLCLLAILVYGCTVELLTFIGYIRFDIASHLGEMAVTGELPEKIHGTI